MKNVTHSYTHTPTHTSGWKPTSSMWSFAYKHFLTTPPLTLLSAWKSQGEGGWNLHLHSQICNEGVKVDLRLRLSPSLSVSIILFLHLSVQTQSSPLSLIVFNLCVMFVKFVGSLRCTLLHVFESWVQCCMFDMFAGIFMSLKLEWVIRCCCSRSPVLSCVWAVSQLIDLILNLLCERVFKASLI